MTRAVQNVFQGEVSASKLPSWDRRGREPRNEASGVVLKNAERRDASVLIKNRRLASLAFVKYHPCASRHPSYPRRGVLVNRRHIGNSSLVKCNKPKERVCLRCPVALRPSSTSRSHRVPDNIRNSHFPETYELLLLHTTGHRTKPPRHNDSRTRDP